MRAYSSFAKVSDTWSEAAIQHVRDREVLATYAQPLLDALRNHFDQKIVPPAT